MNEPSPLQCTVIATVHCDIEDDRRWITALEHDASTMIEVSSIDGDFLRGRLLITRKNPPDLHKNMMEEYALGIRETLYSLNSWPLITQL